MSLLEVITNALANRENTVTHSEYPIILNSDDILLNLKPNVENANSAALANPVTGWELYQTDSLLIELCKKFHAKLKRRLKDTNNFNKDEFVGILIQFLEKIAEKVGISIGVDSSDDRYIQILIQKVGLLIGWDVAGLVLEVCLDLEIWDLVETLVINRIVNHSSYSNLITTLADKNRSDLLCLSVQHASDLGLSELISVLRYFLCPSKDSLITMVNVREEWERQALFAVEKASDKSLPDKKSHLAKEASILLMIAHDGFSVSELCLHYLMASSNIDDVILSSAIVKLKGNETKNLIRYLGKWLKKYEMFPQAGPCPKASTMLDLKACDWVPKLEDIIRYLGLVLDENFSSLVLNPGFHEELVSIESTVTSLASEAKLCCFVSNIIQNLRVQGKGEQT
ncbi:hypothetical protein K2173_019755 [Erythroxylum novogranatense]|uniref:Uncharacterized protein n=1 Tax=Erythroxylum novogranatense TaxID=1862640 RepID=A0AAV8SM78_9ROSI|nr:hypothetical protein K2173_019755 [Erythroxylum novogranatense]